MKSKVALSSLFAVLVLALSPAYAQQAGAGVSDRELTQEVYTAFSRDFHVSYNNELQVRTFGGVVILTGEVEEFSDLKRIVEIASSVPGVKSVDNRITIKSAF